MKIKILFGTLFLWGSLFSQTFEQSMAPGGTINILNNSNYNPGYSTFHNGENRLHNYESAVLRSLLSMYETTLNPIYLDRFVEHAKRVLDRRDYELNLNLAANPNFQVDGGGSGLGNPTSGETVWSTRFSSNNDGWEIALISNGIIAEPLAEFAYFVKVKYPSLASRAVPAMASGTDITGWYVINNYNDFAVMLKAKVDQTARLYFDDTWNNSCACYFQSTNITEFASPNFMCSMGRVHAFMYKLYEAEGNTSLRDYYVHKVRRIAQRLKNFAATGFERDNVNHIVKWKYGGIEPEDPYEDLAHGLVIMEFADLCYQFQIRDGEATDYLLFDNSLMYDFANTFKTKFIVSPLKYSMCITGLDSQQSQLGPYLEGNNARYNQYMNAGRYLFLAQYIPDIYNMIADYFYEYSLYGPGTSPLYCNSATNQSTALDAVAQLAYGKTHYSTIFTNYLDIASVKRHSTYQTGSDLITNTISAGVVSGKFDALKTGNSIASFNQLTDKIEIREFDAQKKISNVVASWVPSPDEPNIYWGKITSGDFIPGNNCDEIIAYNNVDKVLYVFKQNGSSINLLFTYATGKSCAGIATGNFNAVNGDEIVFLSNDDGKVYMYKYQTPNTMSMVTISNNSISTYVVGNPAGIAVGNLDNNASNGLEIVTINNNNGNDYNIKVLNINSSVLSFYPTICQYTGTAGNYSQWDAVSTGDFNNDGFDEILLHRDHDGDFFIQYLDAGMVKSLAKEHFPTDWGLGYFTGIRLPGTTAEHIVSLRNGDGHIFLFRPTSLPIIPGRPVIPIGPEEKSVFNQQPEESINVYPNPSNGWVEIESVDSKLDHVSVTNLMGTQVLETNNDLFMNHVKFDLSEQPAGVYMIVIEAGGERIVRRLVKN